MPENISAVIVSRLAVSMPTSSARLRTPDMSGMIPHLPSSTDQVESGDAMRKSAASAIWSPPPRQWPCTAAMTGTGSRRQAQQASWNVLVPRHGRGTNAAATRRGSAITVAKSRPAQKASPSPSSTTARTDLSARRVRAVATSCSRVSSVSAFIFSGRLSRTRAIPRSVVQVTRASASVTDMRQGYGDA